jgi:hypothetical protein
MGGKYALIVRHHGPICSLVRVTAVALTVAVERLPDLTNRFQWHRRPFDPVRWSVGNRRQDFDHFGFHGVGNEFTRLIDKRVPKVTQRSDVTAAYRHEDCALLGFHEAYARSARGVPACGQLLA